MRITQHGIAVIDGDTHISSWVESTGRLDHDQSLLPILLEYVPAGGTVVDAGAFIGDHTIAYLRKVGSAGKVIAFEPNPLAFGCLAYNCPDALCINAGLAKHPGSMAVCADINAGASFLVPGYEVSDNPVPILPLDQFSFGRLDFFKLDVEGFEMQALRGAINSIARHRPVICTEINPGALARVGTSADEIIAFMRECSYAPKFVYPSDSISQSQLDLLFIPY